MAEQVALSKLCRVCGNILTGRVIYHVKEHYLLLQNAFLENFEADKTNIHPQNFCQSCFSTMKNCEDRGTKTTKKSVFWKEGIASSLALQKSKGGRPIKQKKGGRPKKSVEPKKMTLEDIMNLSPSKPVPRIIEQCVTHVVNIKMKQSILPNQTIQLPTKGPQVKQILV